MTFLTKLCEQPENASGNRPASWEGLNAVTESEWLKCVDPEHMRRFLEGNVPERKLRLFASAGFQEIAHLFPEACQQQAIEMLGQLAEGIVTADVRSAIGSSLHHALPPFITTENASHDPYVLALMLYREFRSSSIGHHAVAATCGRADGAAARRKQCCYLRDIIGNPFQPVAFDPSWQTLSVVRLAQGMYDARSFDKMPDLSDALERAGCRNEAILGHCRKPGEHVRGCWVVDLALGKEGLTDASKWVDHSFDKYKRRQPCPSCAKLLRTDNAKQCFECGSDWHDPSNIIRRGSQIHLRG